MIQNQRTSGAASGAGGSRSKSGSRFGNSGPREASMRISLGRARPARELSGICKRVEGTAPTVDAMATAANGTHTTNGRPNGFSTLTPFLAVSPAKDALRFYCDVFGATIVDTTEIAGVLAHAELALGDGRLQLGEPSPDYHLTPQSSSDDACYSIALYCPDADAVVEKAVAAGATLREPASDFVSGDRFASIRDPFGVRWSIMTRIEDLSDADSAARVAEWAAQFAAGS